jgi:hypothetical protein
MEIKLRKVERCAMWSSHAMSFEFIYKYECVITTGFKPSESSSSTTETIGVFAFIAPV